MVRTAGVLEEGGEQRVMYGLAVRMHVSGAPDVQSLLDHVDSVMENLAELEGCTEGFLDSTVGVDAATGMFEAEVTVDANHAEEAFSLGMSCLRSAIHKAGGHTPDWDDVVPDGEDCVLYRASTEEAMELRPLEAASL
jgi:hypothetical protein